jgi:nucleotide-binding universal stress UspA family protein
MAGTEYGIVAGYDGSAVGGDALRWAARETWARHTTLTVLLACSLAPPGEPALPDLIRLARQRGEHTLASGLQYAGSVVGPARIRAQVTDQPPAQALCERSKAAEMVVVGSHGNGRLPGLLLGSVPWQVAVHGHGRMVVVRGKWRPVNKSPGPVVAGVDGSPSSEGAVAFAFEEAELRDVPLVAVCALADAAGRAGEMHPPCGSRPQRVEQEVGRWLRDILVSRDDDGVRLGQDLQARLGLQHHSRGGTHGPGPAAGEREAVPVLPMVAEDVDRDRDIEQQRTVHGDSGYVMQGHVARNSACLSFSPLPAVVRRSATWRRGRAPHPIRSGPASRRSPFATEGNQMRFAS